MTNPTETTPEETVTISKKEYKHLLRRDLKLSALENGGVDNWEWHDDSLSEYWAQCRAEDEAED